MPPNLRTSLCLPNDQTFAHECEAAADYVANDDLLPCNVRGSRLPIDTDLGHVVYGSCERAFRIVPLSIISLVSVYQTRVGCACMLTELLQISNALLDGRPPLLFWCALANNTAVTRVLASRFNTSALTWGFG